MSWIDDHPGATRVERIKAMAYKLPGTSCDPSDFTLEYYGLESEFDITDEPLETCLIFDSIAMRCQSCDWWFSPIELNDDDLCFDCNKDATRGESA